MKKTLSLLLLFLLMLSLLTVPSSALENDYILDHGKELTEDEFDSLSQEAWNLSWRLDCGVYYLSVDKVSDLHSSEDFSQALAEFYDRHQLGTGEDHRGIILAHALEGDRFCIYAKGRGERIYEDDNWQQMTDVFLNTRQEQGLARAITAYLNLCETILEKPRSAVVDPVQDKAGILTDDESEKLRSLAQEAAEQTGCGIYVYITPDYEDMITYNTGSLSRLSEEFFERNDYGISDDRNGIFLILSMAERDYDIFFSGYCDTALTDRGKDHIEASFLDDFRRDSWYNGMEDFIITSRDCIQDSREGHPYNRITYSFAEHLTGIAVSTCIALLIAWSIRQHFIRQMNSVHPKAQAVDFMAQEGLQLTQKDDEYIHTTTRRVYSPQKSSSGSSRSGGSSGGGGSHRSGKF